MSEYLTSLRLVSVSGNFCPKSLRRFHPLLIGEFRRISCEIRDLPYTQLKVLYEPVYLSCSLQLLSHPRNSWIYLRHEHRCLCAKYPTVALKEFPVKKFSILFVISLCTLTMCWFVGYSIASDKSSSKPLKQNLVKEGDVADTMDRARAFMSHIQYVDFDMGRVDRRLARVPDQDHAQVPEWRSQSRPTFVCSGLYEEIPSIFKGQVAFYSDLYVHRTFVVTPPTEGRATYTGFLIVGWMDGRVEQVPLAKVGLYQTGSNEWQSVFPGMREYSDDLARFGEVPKRSEAPVGTANRFAKIKSNR